MCLLRGCCFKTFFSCEDKNDALCVLLFRIPLLWLFRSQIIGMISSATAAALDVARDRIVMPAAAFSSYLYNRIMYYLNLLFLLI